MKLNNMKVAASKMFGRSGLVIKKHSPEILMVVGVVGVVSSSVMACRATLKVDGITCNAKNSIQKIKVAKEEGKTVSGETYSDGDYNKDMTIVYAQTGVEFVKLYGPAISLGIASIGCLLGAHNIMRKRNLALMAAYKAVEQGFSDYRRRVVEELGAEKDHQFKCGVRKEIIQGEEVDENGKKKKVKAVVETVDPKDPSVYARFFDESCDQWSKTPEYNLTFLKCQQNYMNDKLKARGHVFLNEVYDALGIPRTQAGAIVGWVKGHGDDFVDFGMYDVNSDANVRFVNGYERSILLDFNVDGVIYDLI